MRKSQIIASISAMLAIIMAVLALGMCLVGCSKSVENASDNATEIVSKSPKSHKASSSTHNYTIVVDEDTLVQYIIYYSDEVWYSVRMGGMTARLKPDGTPYTISPEELDDYEHFSFSSQ